jgi:hypothetical protein
LIKARTKFRKAQIIRCDKGRCEKIKEKGS